MRNLCRLGQEKAIRQACGLCGFTVAEWFVLVFILKLASIDSYDPLFSQEEMQKNTVLSDIIKPSIDIFSR